MKKITRGKEVQKSELATILGLSIQTIQLWSAEGMPFRVEPAANKQSVNANIYNTAEVIKWWIRREQAAVGGLDLSDERAKLAREQTEYTKLKNEERRGNLIALEDAIVTVQKSATAIRQKIIAAKMEEADKAKLLEEINALGEQDFGDADGAAEKDVEEDEGEGEGDDNGKDAIGAGTAR